MRLRLHELLANVAEFPGQEYVQVHHYIEGCRWDGHRRWIRLIRSIANDSWMTCGEYDLTFTITVDPQAGLWNRLARKKYYVLVNGPAFAVQIYLHTLERVHGHRR